jgi:hypothetical protein
MQSDSTDFYALLGVAPDASVVEIRRAYRRRLVTSHRERVLDIVSHLRHLRKRLLDAARSGPPAGLRRAAQRTFVIDAFRELTSG